MADTGDLKSPASRRTGSSPVISTVPFSRQAEGLFCADFAPKGRNVSVSDHLHMDYTTSATLCKGDFPPPSETVSEGGEAPARPFPGAFPLFRRSGGESAPYSAVRAVYFRRDFGYTEAVLRESTKPGFPLRRREGEIPSPVRGKRWQEFPPGERMLHCSLRRGGERAITGKGSR